MVYEIPDVFVFVREHLRNVCYLCVATDATCAKVEQVRREKENGDRRRSRRSGGGGDWSGVGTGMGHTVSVFLRQR